MKNTLPLAKAACIIMLLASAFYSNGQITQKQKPQKENKRTTKFGIYSMKPEIDTRLIAANNVGVTYTRQSLLLRDWDGKDDGGIDYWMSHKKKLVLNINNDSTPSYFPTDLFTYKNKLISFLDVYKDNIALAVIENEELNKDTSLSLSHLGSMQDYINELRVAVALCKRRGIPVTNGGIASQITASLKHYYDINGLKDSAKWLLEQVGGIPGDSMIWKRCDSLLVAYRDMDLSYVNLHWYEPKKDMDRITGVLETVCNYITQQTGKRVISNETGTRSDSSFITQLLQQWELINPDYCILFDGTGNGNGSQPLTNSTGSLLGPGMAYRDYLGGEKACPQSITISPSGIINSCDGESMKLTASGGLDNYRWSTGETTQSITVKETGNYMVKSNQENCIVYHKSAAAVLMNLLPAMPIISTNPSPPTDVCPGRDVKLTSTLATTYEWNTGDTSKYIYVNKNGNYSVTISDKNGCKASSAVTEVTYQGCAPPADLEVTDIKKKKATLNWTTIECGKGYRVEYRIIGNSEWTSKQLVNGKTASITISKLEPGVYQWRMFTYCSYSPDTIKSVYRFGPQFTIGEQNDLSNTLAANLNTYEVKVYPVPAKNVAYVSVNTISSDLKITLTDMYGKNLWQSKKIISAVTSIPISNLTSGTYIVTIKDKEHSKTLWLIKE